jgi:hypothetical protein
MVEAVLLDFGRVAAASVSKHVRRLTPQFTSPLPAQAVAVRLGGVAPPGAGPWPEESAERLRELAKDACDFRGGVAGIVAQLQGWGEGGEAVLRLFDTATNSLPGGLDLGRCLVEEGLASSLDTEQLYDQPLGEEAGAGPRDRLEEVLEQQEELLRLAGRLGGASGEERAALARLEEIGAESQLLLARLFREDARLFRETIKKDNYTEVFESEVVKETKMIEMKKAEVEEPVDDDQSEGKESVLIKMVPEEVVGPRAEEREGTGGVHRLQLSLGALHPVAWRGEAWVASAEVSGLHPKWRGYDLLASVLARRNVSFEVESLVAAEEVELWVELEAAGVGGLVGRDGAPVARLAMYRMADLPAILAALHLPLDKEDLSALLQGA